MRKNTLLLHFFTQGLQNDLQHHFTTVPTYPQHFGCPMQHRGCNGDCNGGCLIEKMRGRVYAIHLEVFKTPHTPKMEKISCLTDFGIGIGISKCMLLALITDYHGLTVAILKPKLSALRSH